MMCFPANFFKYRGLCVQRDGDLWRRAADGGAP